MKTHHLSDAPARASDSRALPPVTALLAFERAARLLSFRRAAQALALSPSAVSHQIRGLERRFGVRLFTRNGREVQLTEVGAQYLQRVSAGLALLDEASRDLQRLGRGAPRQLHLSALPFFANTVLIPKLQSFARRCPDVTLHIYTSHQYADFERSPVDAAVRFGRERSTGLKLEPLVAVRGLPVCAPSVAQSGLQRPHDLANQTLIHMSQRPQAWRTWLADVGAADLAPRAELWLDSVPAVLEAAAHGLGVALAMDPLIRAHPGFGTALVAPMPCGSERIETLYFVTRPERAHERNIECLRRWLHDAVKAITTEAAVSRSGKRSQQKQGSA